MRFLLVALLAGLCAYSAAVAIGKKFVFLFIFFSNNTLLDSTNYAKYQKDIFRLFKYINQPSYYKDHVEIAHTYKFHENANLYTVSFLKNIFSTRFNKIWKKQKPEVVEDFYEYYHYETMLPRGHIFSAFNEDHLKQAIALFKLFYYANNFDTLYKTAVWARNYVNEGMFLYSFSVALIHRPDTYYFVLPPIYEIYPHYFYSTEVIHEAQMYKQMYSGQQGAQYNDQTVHANYTGWYMNVHPEQSLSYFTEDVGVNSFYYYYNLYYPYWMDGQEFNLHYDNRGELFFFIYQQILARFYLERLSNDMGEIDYFNWEVPFETGYTPSMQYPNGLEFPSRPNFAKLYEYFYNYGQNWNFRSKYGYSYTHVMDYERRIRDAIDSGFVHSVSYFSFTYFT